MKRSIAAIIATLTLGLFFAPIVASAQQPGKVPRIGVLFPAESPSAEEPSIAAFRQALQHLGYVEGQSIAVDYRYGHGQTERFQAIATALVDLKVDILVIGSGRAVREAQKATSTIPVVMAGAGDPVDEGLVASLARPGGNITGLSLQLGEGFSGKWVELLNPSLVAGAHGEKDIAELIANTMQSAGMDVEIQPVSGGRSNVIPHRLPVSRSSQPNHCTVCEGSVHGDPGAGSDASAT